MITHCAFHLNIDYWDYYILCHLDIDAARVLQRMEYWDNTKAGGLFHAEAINDRLEELGEAATQDTSRFVFKGEEELYWELMASCGEKNIPRIMRFLEEDLHYLTSRRNPYKGFDRTKQFEFQGSLIQQHINKLSAIVKVFLDAGRRLTPVQYAIESLTREGITIETLTVEQIAAKLAEMHTQVILDEDATRYEKGKKPGKSILPKFIRLALKKDQKRGFSAGTPLSIPQIAEIGDPNASLVSAFCGNDSANYGNEQGKLRNRFRNLGGAIPVITISNYNQLITNSNDDSPDRQESQPEGVLADANDPRAALSSLLEHLTDEEIAQVMMLLLEGKQEAPEEYTQHQIEAAPPPSEEISPEASSQKSSEQADSKTSGKKGKASKAAPSARALTILDAWDCVNSGKKMPRTRENVEAAEEMALVDALQEDLQKVRDRLLTQKDGWWKQRGVRLKDIANHFHLAAEEEAHLPKDNRSTSSTPAGQNTSAKRKLLKRATTEEKPELVAASAGQEARSAV
ncbi:MAG: hypothetical protein H0U76_19285 [Ktedonobacteraceae bacterium]|nr:hypothetical protein [Ktedonobacteraceae bacterium]